MRRWLSPGYVRSAVAATFLLGTAAQGQGTPSIPAQATAWWHAFTVGDTAYLRAHTARRLTLTTNGGSSFDQTSLLREAAGHHPAPTFTTRVLAESLLSVNTATAVTMNRVSEGTRNGVNVYRYLTVLDRVGKGWRVSAAQSTRELALTPRVSPSVAGTLADFTGNYRGGRGGIIQIAVRDSVLLLTDPEGGVATLEPIGPSQFELPSLYDGAALVRFVFARDASGRVTSLSRLIYGSVTTWARE